MPESLKTTRPGHHLPPAKLKTLKDIEVCAVAHLKHYVKITVPFSYTSTNQLLLSFVQPHKPISTKTLSRWCVTVMKESGINVNIFGSHSAFDYCSKKLQIQQDGQMKNHLHTFMWANSRLLFKLFI